MDRRTYLKTLAGSPEGMACAAASVAAGAVAGFLSSAAVGAVTGAAAAVIAVSALTLSGAGSRIAARESQRRSWASARPHLEAAKAARSKLAAMRVPDAEVKAALQLVATRGAEYLAACESARSRDPLAEDALSESVALADIYLKELDGASTERRYGLPDDDPFADAKSRTLAALRDKAAVIATSALGLSDGLSPADRMEVKESL